MKSNKQMKALLAISGLLIIIGCDNAESDLLDISQSKRPVQLDYEGAYEFVIGSEASDHRVKSTGAIRIDGEHPVAPYASCGATFISPRHAITAAHCVEFYNLGENFTIEQYDTTQLSRSDIVDYAEVTGNWDNWNHADTLTSADGYIVTPYTQCSVVRRCSDTYGGRDDCPFSTIADIAMVYCKDRPEDSAYVKSKSQTENGKNVEIYWFHEVADLTITSSSSQYWVHYGYLDSQDDNWHYTERHQLVPLLSKSFPDGTLYSAFSRSGTTFGIDTPVCHGASGSGVFEQGTNWFLGPAATGQGSIANRLCHAMNTDAPGTARTGIVHSGLTSQFSDLQEVHWERFDKGTKAALINIFTSV